MMNNTMTERDWQLVFSAVRAWQKDKCLAVGDDDGYQQCNTILDNLYLLAYPGK